MFSPQRKTAVLSAEEKLGKVKAVSRRPCQRVDIVQSQGWKAGDELGTTPTRGGKVTGSSATGIGVYPLIKG